MKIQINLKPIPTKTVELVNMSRVVGLLEKGPVNFACTYEQAKVVNSYVRARLKRGLSQKAIRVDDQVVGWRLEIHDNVKRRST